MLAVLLPYVFFVAVSSAPVPSLEKDVQPLFKDVDFLLKSFPDWAEKNQAFFEKTLSRRRHKRSVQSPLQITAAESWRRLIPKLGVPNAFDDALMGDSWLNPTELKPSRIHKKIKCASAVGCVESRVPACRTIERVDLPQSGTEVFTKKTVQILQAPGKFIQPVIRRLCATRKPTWGNGICRQRFTAQPMVLESSGDVLPFAVRSSTIFVESHCEYIWDFTLNEEEKYLPPSNEIPTFEEEYDPKSVSTPIPFDFDGDVEQFNPKNGTTDPPSGIPKYEDPIKLTSPSTNTTFESESAGNKTMIDEGSEYYDEYYYYDDSPAKGDAGTTNDEGATGDAYSEYYEDGDEQQWNDTVDDDALKTLVDEYENEA